MPDNGDIAPSSIATRKRQAPLDGNGERVELPTKKPRALVAQKKSVNQTKKSAISKSLPKPTQSAPTTAGSSSKRVSSVEIEEVVDVDMDFHSNPPRNPDHILEAADGSDDNDKDDDAETPAKDVEESDGEGLEEAEEDDESKLSQCRYLNQMKKEYSPIIRKYIQEMDLAHLRLLQRDSTD